MGSPIRLEPPGDAGGAHREPGTDVGWVTPTTVTVTGASAADLTPVTLDSVAPPSSADSRTVSARPSARRSWLRFRPNSASSDAGSSTASARADARP